MSTMSTATPERIRGVGDRSTPVYTPLTHVSPHLRARRFGLRGLASREGDVDRCGQVYNVYKLPPLPKACEVPRVHQDRAPRAWPFRQPQQTG
jgi:hypothetical protein